MSHYWRDGEGNDIPLEDLDDFHLTNILRMLAKKKEKETIFMHLCQEARLRKLDWKEN